MIPINEYVETLVNARRYEIMNEALNNKESDFIIQNLNKEYSNKIIKLYENMIRKFKRLNFCRCNKIENVFKVRKNIYPGEETICLQLDFFENYAYCDKLEGKEAEKAINIFKTDLKEFKSAFSSILKPFGMFVEFAGGDYGEPLEVYIDICLEELKQNGYINPEILYLYIIPNNKIIDSLKPSNSTIKENDKKKYLALYDEFYKFIKNPDTLTSKLSAAHITEICKIIGMSSEQLNKLVSKNIKNIGNVYKFTDDDFSRYLKRMLGDCYIIDYDNDSEYIFYSIKNKKMYYVDYEHEDCEIFYNNYPYSSKELEDIVYGDNKSELEVVRRLFEEYDKEKRYNLFQ